MWIADQWKDYEVIDTSNGEKLERWGEYRLIRPDPRSSGTLPAAETGGVPTHIIIAAKRAAVNGSFSTFPMTGASTTGI